MANKTRRSRWEYLYETVRGASHEKSGNPNQDYGTVKRLRKRETVIAAVADGHGSKRYFRSDIGSKLAVEAAIRTWEMLLKLPAQRLHRLPADELELILGGHIVRRWANSVVCDARQHPFSEDQLDAFPELKRDPSLAYGSTLLSVCANETTAMFVQIGDGDILSVSAAGEVHRLFERDKRFIGNETSSLCSADALQQVHVTRKTWVRSQAKERPALILLATDGYSNCFRGDSEFDQVGSDFLAALRRSGKTAVKQNLEIWLREASDSFSRDDITVAMLYRSPLKPQNGERTCCS